MNSLFAKKQKNSNTNLASEKSIIPSYFEFLFCNSAEIKSELSIFLIVQISESLEYKLIKFKLLYLS